LKEHIEKCANAAAQRIDSLLEEEQEPFTMNQHYFMEYRKQFLAHYKNARQSAKSEFKRNLENRDDGNVMEAVTDTLLSLTRLGLEATNASVLDGLLPTDPMDPAIEIMAEVRAYFQGSYRIFFLPFLRIHI
jgi:hypothetical protein